MNNSLFWMILLILMLPFAAKSQYYIITQGPSENSPCLDYPIEIELINDGSEATNPSEYQLFLEDGFSFVVGSSSQVGEADPSNSAGPIFSIPPIEACESLRFSFLIKHECANSDIEYELPSEWRVDGQDIDDSGLNVTIQGLKLSIRDVQVFYDSVDMAFKKKFTILNHGKVILQDFIFYIEGEDNMDILSSNLGQLSGNGDTLTFGIGDYVQIGNQNSFFEPGERIDIIQEIDLNACREGFPFIHKMEVECGDNICEFEVEAESELVVTVGTPRLITYQNPDMLATPCDTGEIFLKFTNRSLNGSFPQANAMYNIFIHLGWSVIRNNRRTGPTRDNCLRFLSADVKGQDIPLSTAGVTGWALDFTRLNADPDGPGGLDDIDGDGRFDDLNHADTIYVRVKYIMRRSCLNYRCSGQVFGSRLLMMEADFENYCNEADEVVSYLGRHSYQWSGFGGSFSGIDGVYAKGDQDTLTIRLSKSISGFLQNCPGDSGELRIYFPSVVTLPPGAIVLYNGDTVNYRYFGNRLTLGIDSVRGSVQIPIEFDCEPGSGGNIQTACTFCLGSGLPKYKLRVEMDYKCNDGCYGDVPLICFDSPEFFSLCDSASKGIVSEGKFVIEDMEMIRQSLGYTDSSRTSVVNPNSDSLNLDVLMTYDTFNLVIPFDIRCDANYTNLRYRLLQSSIIQINGGIRDTFKYFDFISDTLKYFDSNLNRWRTCDNVLGAEYFNTANDGYRNNYVKEVDLSSVGCLNRRFSVDDSLVIIVKGVVRNRIRNNIQRLNIRSDLTYRQDGCAQNSRARLFVNVISGYPHPGFTSLIQPYTRDTNYNRYYTELSVCGDFELNTYLDNFYYNLDSIDPFKNEFRHPFDLKEIKLVVPNFFRIDSLPYNYIQEYYQSSKRIVIGDTSKIAYSIRDSADYYIITYPLAKPLDFYGLRHRVVMKLVPECYGFLTDTIRVFKSVRVQTQNGGANSRDSIIRQRWNLNVVSLNPVVSNIRHQFLYQNKSVTSFQVLNPVRDHVPSSYFDFHNGWMRLFINQNNVRVDSLVGCTDSTCWLLTPEVLSDASLLYRLDTVLENLNFKLYSTIENCEKDTIRLEVGSKCDTYPLDWLDVDKNCDRFVEKRNIIIEPETPDLIGEFTAMPDSSQREPCDTFLYEMEFRNINLGHLRQSEFILKIIEGLDLISAEIEYPENLWMDMGNPDIDIPNMSWNLESFFDSTGFKGFYDQGLNFFKVRIKYVGNCDIQDGAIVVARITGKDLCNEIVETGKINSLPLTFKKDSLAKANDIYELDLSFSGDTLCGETFVMTATFTSKDVESLEDLQRIIFSFENELSFIPGSYKNNKNAGNTPVDFQRLEDKEILIIDVPLGIPLGDSISFSLTLERTCSGICKMSQFDFEILTPTEIGCPSVPAGNCNILIGTQKWAFDSIIVSPYYRVIDGTGRVIRNGTDEILETNFTFENLSDFDIKTFLDIRIYQDINGNGILDSNDIEMLRDSLSTEGIKGGQFGSITSQVIWTGALGCSALVEISPDNNPCLCKGDTLYFGPFEIEPQSMKVRTCFDQRVDIGFEEVVGYDYMWLDASKVDQVNQAMTRYIGSDEVNKNSTRIDTVLLEASRLSGCSVIDTAFVERYRPEISIHQVDSILCHGGNGASAVANLEGGDGSSLYEWINGDTTPLSTNLMAGIYQVVGKDENGCSDTISIIIQEPDSLLYDLGLVSNYNGYPIKCFGDQNGWITIAPSGGTPDYSFEWNGESGTNNRLDSLAEGWTYYKIIDANGCEVEDSILLASPPPILSEIDATKAGCDDQNLAKAWASAEGGVEGFSYEWVHGAQGDTAYDLMEGMYIVEISDANGCLKFDTIEVEKHPDPDIRVSILDTLVDYGKSVRLFAYSNTDSVIYVWYPEDEVSCDTCQNTVVTPTEFIIIQVKVVDKNGCESWADIRVRVEVTKRVWAPNAFTPTGDQINDGFTLFGNPTLEEIEYLSIFDRWGEQVFLTHAIEPGMPQYGWDGVLNGEPMNPAVFAWIARVRFFDGEVRWMSGDVTLIR